MRSPADLATVFRKRGMKLTPQRQLLFRLLYENGTHPSAEALYTVASEQMPGISLRTVYQTLSELVALGELRHVALDSGSVRFDPNVADHHHIVCAVCGEIRDVYVQGADELDIDGLDGFVADSTDIVFRGRCRRCAASDPNHNPNPTERETP